jgi:methylenetetrahydrofolate reductase (NADPH)
MVSCQHWYVPPFISNFTSLTLYLVHNDFHQTHGLFSLFDGLVVEDLDKPFEVPHTNGTAETNGVNGTKPAEDLPLTNGDGSH